MAGQDRGGNEGFSGTPMWKVQQQMAQYWKQQQEVNKAASALDDGEPAQPPNVLVDAVTLRGSGGGDTRSKPLVRHVIVKDLNKLAGRLKVSLPRTLVFKNKAPMGLYALFDGQSCAGEPGSAAADFCARNIHSKVLDNLSRLPDDRANEAFVKAALIKSFEDLDSDMMKNHLDIIDGCGAAVVLLVGHIAFTAVVGKCKIVLSEVEEEGKLRALSLGGENGDVGSPGERQRLRGAGASVVGEGVHARLRHPAGALSAVSRSLGDRTWKGVHGGGLGPPLVSCAPEVKSTPLKGADGHPFLLLYSSPIATVWTPRELVDQANEYQMQPRACCGELAAKCVESMRSVPTQPEVNLIEVCFLPGTQSEEDKKRAMGALGPEAPPSAKRQKLEKPAIGGGTQSVRLRHILLKYVDSTRPKRPGEAIVTTRGPVTRSREDAEQILRSVFKELVQVVKEAPKKPKNAAELVLMQSKRFSDLCKEHSDCETARKGGAMCGDLGWMMPDSREKLGANFAENVKALRPGQWSDITFSEQGMHLIQRVA